MLTGFKINSYSKVINTVLLGLPDQSFTVSLGPPGCIFFYGHKSRDVNENLMNPSVTGYSVPFAHQHEVDWRNGAKIYWKL